MPTAVEQRPPVKETPRSPERVSPPGQFDALKPRLLMGGNAINPDHPLPAITQDQLGSFASRNYDIFTTASANERKRHWQGKENNDFERQKRVWIEQTTATFTNAKDWFEKSEQGKQWASLYKRLGIEVTSFSAQNAEQLYNAYFSPGQSESPIKKFVAQVANAYQQGNTIDHAGIERDLKGIQWLGNIFGETSAEVVAQLIDAEVALLTKPDTLIAKANQTQEVNNQPVARINRLEADERRLLKFLWNNRTADVTPTPRPTTPPTPQAATPSIPSKRRPEGYKWEYQRPKPDEPRKFPHAELVQQVSEPYSIAFGLKNRNPQKYRNSDVNQLAAEIQQEHAQLDQTLIAHGLTQERLSKMTVNVLTHYERFVQQTYGISLPKIEDVTLFPISGKTAEYYNPGRQAYAFVDTRFPIIFLDMDVITDHARRLPTHKDWRELPKEELGNLMQRLLNEIKPHEYTHLMGDLAYWKLSNTATGNVEDLRAGKLGLLVSKPKEVIQRNGHIQVDYAERGRGLMEAVTVELTKQWAENMNAQLDINAYAPERQVLQALKSLLAKEQNISEDETFKKFVAAYFTPKGFRDLAKDLAGKHEDQAGHIVYKRPHFQSIIYALMERETEAAFQHQTEPNYPLTIAYITNTLSQAQKDDLIQLAKQGVPHGSRVHLPLAARRSLAAQLGFTLEVPRQEPPAETPPAQEEAAQIADRLLNYQNAQVTNERVDLSGRYAALVDRVHDAIDSKNPAIPVGESVIFSDVAYAMIEKLAEESNVQNKEINFALQGITIPNRHGESVLVGAYVAPAGVFANHITTDVDPALHTANATKLARNTNLGQYFQDHMGSPVGEALAVYHTHPDSLGPHNRATPSTPDYEQINTWFRNDPHTREYYWGVFTKHDGQLHLTLMHSYLDQQGKPQHRKIPAKRESDLP